MLVTIHFACAKFLECPELQLADEEAAQMAAAAAKVAEQYDTVISPKVQAWFNLAGVCGAIYGTRIYAIYARQKAQRAAAKVEQPRNVVDIKVTKGAAVPAPGQGSENPRTPADMFGLNYSASIAAEI